MESNYPEGYFEHYLICSSTANITYNRGGYKQLAIMYRDMEGQDASINLVEEIKLVEANNDWSYFVGIAKEFDIDIDIEQIKELASVTVEVLGL